ncbi:hypothetical protein V6N13_014031 [Hibiscus sabdariffa]
MGAFSPAANPCLIMSASKRLPIPTLSLPSLTLEVDPMEIALERTLYRALNLKSPKIVETERNPKTNLETHSFPQLRCIPTLHLSTPPSSPPFKTPVPDQTILPETDVILGGETTRPSKPTSKSLFGACEQGLGIFGGDEKGKRTERKPFF